MFSFLILGAKKSDSKLLKLHGKFDNFLKKVYSKLLMWILDKKVEVFQLLLLLF